MYIYIYIYIFIAPFLGKPCPLSSEGSITSFNLAKLIICRLNYAQRPISQVRVPLTGLKSHFKHPRLKLPPGAGISTGFEPANLGLKASHASK